MATQGQTAPCAGYRDPLIGVGLTAASWRSGDAADCKSVYTGSIPVLASKQSQPLNRYPSALTVSLVSI